MTKTLQVYDTIKDLVFRNLITPGERIYFEDLSKRLNVSSTPLREALNRLVQEGFFCHTSHRGYVLRITSTREFEELYEFCEALETYAIERAINNVTPEVLTDLRQSLETYRDLSDSRERFILNNEFHLKIASLSGNNPITDHLAQILDRITLKWKVENIVHSRGSMPYDEHMAIYVALESKDIVGAVTSMRNHIVNTKKSVLNRLKMKENLFIKVEVDGSASG